MFLKVLISLALLLFGGWSLSWLTYLINYPSDFAFAGGILGGVFEAGILLFLFEKLWFGGNYEKNASGN